MIRKSEITWNNFFLKENMDVRLRLDFWLLFFVFSAVQGYDERRMQFKKEPPSDNHRCGVCPTYFRKICAFDPSTNATHIFDNHCIMDLYNCIEGTDFNTIKYDKCLYFGNFAYVHGYKHEDEDYGEDHVIVKHSKKNPDFIL